MPTELARSMSPSDNNRFSAYGKSKEHRQTGLRLLPKMQSLTGTQIIALLADF